MKNLQLTAILFTILTFAAAPATSQETVRHLSGDEALKAALNKPQPEYPPVARQLRIQGRVEVEVSIDPSGTVDNVKVLSGNPALTGTLTPTLKRWRFEPILSEGKPVHAIAVLGFSFKL